MKIPYFLIILTVYLSAEFSEGQKYKCETPKLKNGKVRIRSRGQVARFRCKKRFKLAGAKIALCIKNVWNFPVPVCVAPGRKCPKQKFSKDLLVTERLNRGYLEMSCKPGLTLVGKDKIYCDGSNWSDEAAKCVYDISTEATTVPLATTDVSTETESSSNQSAPTTETDSTANPTTDNNRPTQAMSTAISETPSNRTGHFADTTTFSEFTDLHSKTQIPTHLTSISTKRKSKFSTSHPVKIDSTTVLKPNMGVKNLTTKSLATTELRMTTEQYINITTTGSNTGTNTTEPITHINTGPTRITQTSVELTTFTTSGPKQETKITEQPSTKAKTTEQSTTSTTVKSSERTKTTEKLTTLTTAERSRDEKATEEDTTLTTRKPSVKTTATKKLTATTNKGTIITTQRTTTPTSEPKRTTTSPPSSTQKPPGSNTTSPPTTTGIKTTTAVSVKTSSIPSKQSTTVTRSTDSTTLRITSTTQPVSSKISHFSTYRATTTPSNRTAASTSFSRTTMSVNTTTPVQSTTESMDFNNTLNEDIVPATTPPQNDTDIPNVIVASQQSHPDNTPIKPLVIGLGVGVAIGLVILIVGTYLWVKRRRRKEEECDEMRPITGTGSQEW